MHNTKFLKHVTERLYQHLHGTIIFPLLALIIYSAGMGFSQTLSWATAVRDSSTPVGGQSQRPGVGAVNWNGSLWVAYLGTSKTDSKGDLYVYTAYNSGGTTFSNKHQVITQNSGQTVGSISNPALTVYNGNLYLFYNDGYGDACYVYSSDGVTWSAVYTISNSYFFDASPSVTVFNDLIYVGLRNKTDHTLILSTVNSSNSLTSTDYTDIKLQENPGLAVFNDTLYIAIEDYSNDHAIYYYTTRDGVTLSAANAGASSDQTSTAPTLAVHNNVLYLGFRSNDGSTNFLYKYTTNGVTWSSSIEPHFGISGNPTLINTTNLSGNSGNIFLFYTSESSPTYLCSTSAQ